MSAHTASIRELRTNFRSVKRRIEQHGAIVITDHGEAAYVLKLLPSKPAKRVAPPDYYARLRKRHPKPLSPAATSRFWREERR